TDAELPKLYRDGARTGTRLWNWNRKFSANGEVCLFAIGCNQVGLRQYLKQPLRLERLEGRPEVQVWPEREDVQRAGEVKSAGSARYGVSDSSFQFWRSCR